MHVNVTFRHLEASDAVRDYVRKKLQRLARVLDDSAQAHVVLSVEKFRHRTEVALVARNLAVNGVEETDDMYSAIDLVTDKLERQIRRATQVQRAKQRTRKPRKPAREHA